MRERIAIKLGAAAAFIVLLLAWIGGYDFNARGPEALMTAFWTLLVGIMTGVIYYTYPHD